MAPQPAKLTAQDRLDNDEAQIGAAEDAAGAGNELQPANQGQTEADPLGGGVERREPIRMSPKDDMRAQIAAKFRRVEPEDEVPFDGDMSNPANLYGEFGRAVDPDADEDPDDAASVVGSRERVVAEPQERDDDQQPRMITRKVRGRDVTMSEDEWLDRASQVTAADSYLEEARETLKAAREIKAGRAAPTDQHPDRKDSTHDDELDPPVLDDDTQHPETSLRDIVEKIQFGDVDEAADLLGKAIQREAKKEAKTGALQTVFDQDLKRSQKALKDFGTAHPELADDEDAAMLIERRMYILYREDMKKLGLDDSQIPKDNAEAANWHRFYRVNGYEVRPTSALLEAAGKHVSKRLGVGQVDPSSQPQRKEKPRVAVNVDRDARRQNIPLQPQRAVVPRRDVVPAAQKGGSAIVAEMRKARGQV